MRIVKSDEPSKHGQCCWQSNVTNNGSAHAMAHIQEAPLIREMAQSEAVGTTVKALSSPPSPQPLKHDKGRGIVDKGSMKLFGREGSRIHSSIIVLRMWPPGPE